MGGDCSCIIDNTNSRGLQVELGKVLGKGSFGEVFLGMLANKQVAVKNVRIRGQSEAKSFGRANSALSKLRDTNVITFYGKALHPNHDSDRRLAVLSPMLVPCGSLLPQGQ